MSRIMPYKAKLINPHVHNRWIEGFYANQKATTYCFTEDYEKFPVKTTHYIICDEMTDWGLPNQFRFYEVDENTICKNTELEAMWQVDDTSKTRTIWEHDLLKVEYDETVVVSEVMYTDGMFILVSSEFADGYVPLFDYINDGETHFVEAEHLGSAFDKE